MNGDIRGAHPLCSGSAASGDSRKVHENLKIVWSFGQGWKGPLFYSRERRVLNSELTRKFLTKFRGCLFLPCELVSTLDLFAWFFEKQASRCLGGNLESVKERCECLRVSREFNARDRNCQLQFQLALKYEWWKIFELSRDSCIRYRIYRTSYIHLHFKQTVVAKVLKIVLVEKERRVGTYYHFSSPSIPNFWFAITSE